MAIWDCIPYFTYDPSFTKWDYQLKDNQVVMAGGRSCSGVDMVNSYSHAELLEAVKLAWEGYFGDFPRYRGHKICPVCRKIIPSDMKFCGQCGRELPDMYFFEDMKHDLGRYQLAVERKCDVMDIPSEEVEARIPHIDEYAGS